MRQTAWARLPLLASRVALACAALALTSAAAAAQARDWPSEGPPRPLPAREVKFPPYQVQTLPNGLQVVTVLHHEQPVVSMRLIVRAGSATDPKAKLGLAHLAASLLDQGTTTKSAGELNDTIDFIGGAMGAGAGADLSFVNMVVMKDSFEMGLRMLSDIARHPAFAPAEIDRQRQQILSTLQVSREDPAAVAESVFNRLVYGFHPYGMPRDGTAETITAITRDDLVAFHRTYFAPNNAILAIVGDVAADESFETVKKAFGDWERRDVTPERYPDPPDATRRVVVVNKPDAVQTEVRVGHLGIARKNADYMAMNLAIRILGGEGSNRLHQVLRTERGLTYGAQADMDTLKDSGDVEAQTNTRSEATGEVLRLIVDQFWRLQRERVDERELEGAKAYLTGSFPLTIETPDAIAMQILNVIFYDLPLDQLQNFRERVNAVTADDIQRVARAYLKPDRLSVVLVGNAAAFAPQLRGIGFGTYDTVELPALDLTATDLKRAGGGAAGAGAPGRPGAPRRQNYRPASEQAPVTPIAPEEGAKARKLLGQVLAAKGGLDRLRSIKSIVAVSSERVLGRTGGPSQAQTTTYLLYPDHFRVERRVGEATEVQVFDGQRAWVRDPIGIQDVAPAQAREFRASLDRDIVRLLLGGENGSLRMRLLPDVKDDAGVLHHALEFSGPALDPVVLYVDPSTSLVTKQAYIVKAPGQPLVEEMFSEYRPIDGVQVASLATVRRGGQPILERRIGSIRINAPIDAALFKRPTS